jgi:hypothetical protein
MRPICAHGPKCPRAQSDKASYDGAPAPRGVGGATVELSHTLRGMTVRYIAASTSGSTSLLCYSFSPLQLLYSAGVGEREGRIECGGGRGGPRGRRGVRLRIGGAHW